MTPTQSRPSPPRPPLAPAPGLWRRTPPAIFPPLMGLFGLGLGWRMLADLAGSSTLAGLAEAFLGAVSLLFAFAFVAWLAKPLRRPSVLVEELSVLPGRAGVAAAALCLMLLAVALLPYGFVLAGASLAAGVALLALTGALVLRAWIAGPAEARQLSPAFHLIFVGYIIAALTLVPLGQVGLARAVFWLTLPIAGAIWAFSLGQFARRVPPAPLRPLLAIHAAPAALFALVAAQLGWAMTAAGFAFMALALVVAMAVSARWLLASGFSAMWGALTFPLAASANAVLAALPGAAGLWTGAALLFAATMLNPFVAQRVLRSWARGGLAAQTNAATA
ncbi:MAG: tellurium resistance protein [Pararhodobacter sp.]|nr:tellurium resistance protein [Pararhodobacter sp.]